MGSRRRSAATLEKGTSYCWILHVGQYANHDSADGPKSRVPLDGDGIGITAVRFVSGTDDRLVFEDNSERITCLKLDYHAEETVPIRLD